MSSQSQPPVSPLCREVFLAALERSDPQERAAFLDSTCGRGTKLREEVDEVLREAGDLDSFMEAPVLTVAGQAMPDATGNSAFTAPFAEQPGATIGKYKLVQKLGEGGCGVVYLAQQQEPLRREVALKVIKLGMDTRQVIARFETERQALALMDHPNIARVFDAGATDTGRPFFVMELVRGVKLTEYCDQAQLSMKERLLLFIEICSALQHAHQKGIIHRDIKPSNILVAVQDGKPVPKIIDFGVAKATSNQQLNEATLLTSFGHFIGTPAYMSPEQAEMSGVDIDTRSDIYSLGVLLYELLTGRTPFDGSTLMKSGIEECRRAIREQDPALPSTQLSTLQADELTQIAGRRRSVPTRLIETVHGDLDWIVMKALEKDRTRRYATAAAFAQDIEYYLANEPVLARPPSSFYRMQKLIRRRRGTFAAVTGIALALLLGTAASVWQAIRATRAENEERLAEKTAVQLRRKAERERERAEVQANLARQDEYTADINLAQQSLEAGNYGRAVHLLNKHQPKKGEPDLRGFEWRYLWSLSKGDTHASFPAQDGSVRWITLSSSGDLMALGMDEKVNVWDLHTGTLIHTLKRRVISGAFSPDARNLVVGTSRQVLVFDTATWTETTLPGGNAGPVAISKDGAKIATAGEEGVRVWSTADWRVESTLQGASPPFAFSPDSKFLAANAREGITVWQLTDSTAKAVLENSAGLFGPRFRDQLGRVLAFSGDGLSIIAPRNRTSSRGTFALNAWDANSGAQLVDPRQRTDQNQHSGMIAWLAISPDGKTLATASMDHSIHLADALSNNVLATLHGHMSEVWTLAFSADSKTLVTGAKDGSVNFWAIPYESKEDVLEGSYWPLAFSRDGLRFAALDYAHRLVSFVNTATRTTEREFPLESQAFGPGFRISLSADFRVLAELQRDGTVKIRDTVTGETRSVKPGGGFVDEMTLSPDGRQLITSGPGQPLRWWDIEHDAKLLLEMEPRRVLFSPDGTTLAMFGPTEGIELWNVASRSRRLVLKPGFPLGLAVAFSADGRLFAAASNPLEPEQSIHLWETARGDLIGTCIGHKQGILSLAFSADGKALASASHDNTLKFWSIATQQELLSLPNLGNGVNSLAFSPDGTLLATSQSTPIKGIRFYSAPPTEETIVLP